MVWYFQSEVVSPPVTLFMGANKSENQDLLRWGWPEDVWFHVDKLPSSHLYIRLKAGQNLNDIPAAVLQDAAQLVKANSFKGNKKNNVSVVYTMWSNIKQRLLENNDEKMGSIEFHNLDEVHHIIVDKRKNDVMDRLNSTKRIANPDLKSEREQRDEEESINKLKLLRMKKEEEESTRETPHPTSWTTVVKKNKRTRTIGKEDFNNDFVYYNLRTGKGFIKKIADVFGPYTENIIILGAVNRTIEDFKSGRNSHLEIFERIELLDQNNCIYTSVSTILEASQRGQINGMTYFVIVFCGALLNAAEKLLKAGLAPKKIIEYFKLGEKTALDILKTLKIEAPDVSEALDPFFEHEIVRNKFLSTAKPAKILYYSCAVSLESMILHEQIRSISRGYAIILNKRLSIDRWALLLRMADINVVISEKGFDEYTLRNLMYRGIIPVTLQNGFDALRVQKTIGAKSLLEFKCEELEFYESVVAKVHQIKVENIAGDVYFAMIQKEKADVKTIVIEDTTFKNAASKVEAPDVSKALDPFFEHELVRNKFLCTAKPAKILHYSCAVSLESMILHEAFRSSSRGYALILNQKLSIDRWALLLRMADINVVISEKGFDEYTLRNFMYRGIMPVTLQNGFDALRVQKTIGAKSLLEFKCEEPEFYESVVAKVHQIKVENIAGDVYFAMIQKQKADVKTIVIEDTTFKNAASKVSKHLDASKNNRFVPGGGATEMHIAHQLILFADKYAGKDEELRLGIKTFAAAFEKLPRILADNLKILGLSDLMQQLKEEHSKGRKNMGLSFKRDSELGISDVLQCKNYELLLAKKLGIQYALEAAECILK